MRVTIFTAFDTALNPYILLFKKALKRKGLTVRFERNFNLNWLLSKANSSDCIHLHWLNLSHTSLLKNKISVSDKFILLNGFLMAIFDKLRLIEFIVTFFLSKLFGKIIVFTVHDLYDFKKKSARWKFQIQIARIIVFRFANSIHVHNYHTKKLIELRFKRRKNVYVVPHGNFIGYYSNTISKSEARYQLEISDDAIVYLFLGLLRPYKGLEDLIQAFKNLKCQNARLLIAGRAFGVQNYALKLKTMSQSDSRIKLVPEFIPDNEIQIYLNACDFFILPYKNITTSGAAALSLSFGRPIIAPSIASFPEIVNPEVGILYDPNKPDALINALSIAKDQQFTESDILDYAHKFDWDELGSQLIQLYHL